ncbi:MAG TPA: hypothetical protein VJ694_03440 [Patescibacteria group bacterium]|nr:hypothetical protein [Patescibacteria group bacterium]
MPDDPLITDERPQSHRAGAWVVLLVGIVGLVIGVGQWRGSFGQVFAKRTSAFKTPSELEAQRLEEMKTKDTDADGLNDYEESKVYQTSPYLSDSDSDGVDDKTELAKGDDPNCPAGKDCAGLATAIDTQTTASATAAAQLTDEEKAVMQQFMNPTPEQIRQMLLQSGVKPEAIKDIDDATLLELYRQSLSEAQATLPTKP